MIGASTGLFGAVWAQAEVRKALKASGAHVLESELPVGMADGAFDDGGASRTRAGRAARRCGRRPRARGGRSGRAVGVTPAATDSPAVRGSAMIGSVHELPLAFGDGPRERADAARNRLRILAAAAELVGERGIDGVSMDDVAHAACVGTGTLYRRFGDRAGLALALLDQHTREFQNALIAGPPPLGPGAPAAERLRAFGDGYLDLLERHADLMVAAAPGGREPEGPYQLYATHLAILLRDAAPGLDAHFTAQALLGMLAPGQHVRARSGLGWSRERLRAGWRGLVDALVD